MHPLRDSSGSNGAGATFSTVRHSTEKALIVSCEFSAKRYRQRVTPAARLASMAAAHGREPIDDRILRNIQDAPAQSTAPSPSSDRVGPYDNEPRARSAPLSAEAAECKELVESAGAGVMEVIVQRRERPDPATLVGRGKLQEIGEIARARNADLIVFEQDLSPSQLREVERALPCRVIDRTQLILDIFASHARTREGQLQVELAQLAYMLPRLAGRGRAMSQLGGGIGTRGPGETQLETDRRKIGRRIKTLESRLETVRAVRKQQSHRRSSAPIPTIALVGYTNAGKSTLFNALTRAGVLESGRMFATLDPKLRRIGLPSRRPVLLSDTVGFIRTLPHTLIQAFRATLEEVRGAEILIHVMDASSPSFDLQREEVEKVLRELEIDRKPRIEVMNKIDLPDGRERAVTRHENAVVVSARTGEGIPGLLAALDNALASDPIEQRDLEIPQREGAKLAALDAGAMVLDRRFTDATVHLSVRGPASLLRRYRNYWTG